jgi:hypothetical protein
MLDRRFSAQDEAFFRSMMFAEEDRQRFTAQPWDGSFRWFQSPNVTPLEHYKRAATPSAPVRKPAA